ncbi:ROK family protein [Sunxiuqinia sp. A32]|uniref:ROK family protein n=1 Tax=Sunxiuqinia sp. A32 TaxID=3461496 RepID=UPI00404659D0
MKKNFAIGVDVGGSHISSVLVDIDHGVIQQESLAVEKVDNQASAQAIIENWAKAIRKTMNSASEYKLAGIGFAMPGPFDYQNGISLIKDVAKYDNLYGVNVGKELKKILTLPVSMPFRYLNDAISFAVGECWNGQASTYKNVMAITLGTGFGSAFLTNSIPVVEGDRVPEKGYVYHIPYEDSIADDYFSTRWFIAEYKKQSGETCSGVKQLAELAANDSIANSIFEKFGENLANFLIPLFAKFQVDCLVIGGNISGAYSLFGKEFNRILKEKNIQVEVVISELKESAALVGSARLLDENFWTKVESLVSKI